MSDYVLQTFGLTKVYHGKPANDDIDIVIMNVNYFVYGEGTQWTHRVKS